MGNVFTLIDLAITNERLTCLNLIYLHKLIGIDHLLNLELLWVFDFKTIVTALGNVDLGIEVIYVVFIGLGGIYDFYFFIAETKIFLAESYNLVVCLHEFLDRFLTRGVV